MSMQGQTTTPGNTCPTLFGKCVGSLIQRVQNAAARLVYNADKYCHTTPLLFKLHWLPIRERILFKILLITYKAVHGHAPNYIKELIEFKKPGKHNLRSNSDK